MGSNSKQQCCMLSAIINILRILPPSYTMESNSKHHCRVLSAIINILLIPPPSYKMESNSNHQCLALSVSINWLLIPPPSHTMGSNSKQQCIVLSAIITHIVAAVYVLCIWLLHFSQTGNSSPISDKWIESRTSKRVLRLTPPFGQI